MISIASRLIFCAKTPIYRSLVKFSVTSQNNAKVLIAGSESEIVPTLSLMLKLNPFVKELALVGDPKTDICLDLNHINTACKVSSHKYTEINEAMDRSNIIVVTAGKQKTPEISDLELMEKNYKVVGDILMELPKSSVVPYVFLITDPINYLVPYVGNLFKSYIDAKYFSKYIRKLFGFTSINSVRASTFYAAHIKEDPSKVIVPVVGGRSKTTALPLFSMANFPLKNDSSLNIDLIEKVRASDAKVFEAKQGGGSAVLSVAFAANEFINMLLESHYGKTVIECAFSVEKIPEVENEELVLINWMCCGNICILHKGQLHQVVDLDNLTDLEKQFYNKAKLEVAKESKIGWEYSYRYNATSSSKARIPDVI